MTNPQGVIFGNCSLKTWDEDQLSPNLLPLPNVRKMFAYNCQRYIVNHVHLYFSLSEIRSLFGYCYLQRCELTDHSHLYTVHTI